MNKMFSLCSFYEHDDVIQAEKALQNMTKCLACVDQLITGLQNRKTELYEQTVIKFWASYKDNYLSETILELGTMKQDFIKIEGNINHVVGLLKV